MEERLSRRDLYCPVCRAEVGADFLVCPVCTTKLRQACVSCKAPLEALWQVCPYCETPVVRRTPVFDETVGFPAPLHDEPLRAPARRRRARAEEEETAEDVQ